MEPQVLTLLYRIRLEVSICPFIFPILFDRSVLLVLCNFGFWEFYSNKIAVYVIDFSFVKGFKLLESRLLGYAN